MKKGSILIISMLLTIITLAQKSNTIVVQADDQFSEVIKLMDLYSYEQFREGKVFFKDGGITDAKLNYNIFLEEMQFINKTGDTLSIANDKLIRYISFDKDTFYSDNGFFEFISGNNFKLAKKQIIKIEARKLGAYDIPSASGSGISTISYTNDEMKKLKVRENEICTKETTFYLGDRFNHFIQANKKNLYKMIGSNDPQLDKYLKENSINFSRSEDLKKLITFLNNL